MIRIGSGDLTIESSASALRSALALSCASGLPFQWEGFRRKAKGSASPGLRPVDVESVRLFAQITGARVDGVPPERQLLSAGARVLLRLLFPSPGLRDYTCSFRAYRVGALRR